MPVFSGQVGVRQSAGSHWPFGVVRMVGQLQRQEPPSDSLCVFGRIDPTRRQRRGVRHLDAYCRVARPAWWRHGRNAGATRLPHPPTPAVRQWEQELRLDRSRAVCTAVNVRMPSGVMRLRTAGRLPGRRFGWSILESSYLRGHRWLRAVIDGQVDPGFPLGFDGGQRLARPRAVASGCAAWLGVEPRATLPADPLPGSGPPTSLRLAAAEDSLPIVA